MIDTFFIGGSQPGRTPTPLLGGNKAANLARLQRLGLRVPPAIVLGTSVWREYATRGELPRDFRRQMAREVRRLEQATGMIFGGRNPLIVSVRSSPGASMPGMLDTVVNVGLNPQTVHGLIRRTGNPWLAWDAYRRFARSFGAVVLQVPPRDFDRTEADALSRAQVQGLDELDASSLRELATACAAVPPSRSGMILPVDPMDQLTATILAVLRSWNSPRAAAYRTATGIAHDLGTGVLIQAMVFGNAGARSGSGVGFTRNPSTGRDELYVDFASNAQGDDVVAGRHAIDAAEQLRRFLPEVYRELLEARRTLERGLRDMQDFEFTVEEGELFFLQTRDAKRTPWAALQVAVDLVRGGVIAADEAVARLARYDLDAIARTSVRSVGARRLGSGVPAVPGAVSGPIVLGEPTAEAVRCRPILVRRELATEDFTALSRAAGLITVLGGRTSHAAVVARQLNTPCIVGCADLQISADRRSCILGDQKLADGEIVTIDGDSGAVYAGEVPLVTERPEQLLDTVREWQAEAGRRTSVMAGANP